MKIGIIGAGNIGALLATKLGAAGHDVAIANSRGPETIDPGILTEGVRAVAAADAVTGAEVVIVSVPFAKIADLAGLLSQIPQNVPLIDTANYYPERDGRHDAIDAGQVESVWVAQTIGRPLAKAWNSIVAPSLADKGTEPGAEGRIALPVAADRDEDRRAAMDLVEQTGFDAVDAGRLAESWRQQPGAPVYCTDLTREQVVEGLAHADRGRVPKRRDLAWAAIDERTDGFTTMPDFDWVTRLNRVLYR